MQSRFKMKSRIRRISASVDNALSFGSGSTESAAGGAAGGCSGGGASSSSNFLNASADSPPHGHNPSSKSLDICVPESRIDRMRKLLSSPLLRRRNASQHGSCSGHHHHHHQQSCGHQHSHHHNYYPNKSCQGPQALASSLSCSSSPSGSPAALGGCSMKTFGVSLESLSNHQHPHHHHRASFGGQHSFGSGSGGGGGGGGQQTQHEYYVRETETIVVPHQKAAHILGQVCPACLISGPTPPPIAPNSISNSSGSINDTLSSSGHHTGSLHMDDGFHCSLGSSMIASPSCGTNSSSTSSTSSTSGAGGPCLIPFIVTRLCSYIEASGGIQQEGLFRISGNVKLIEKLKHSFDTAGDAPLETEGDLASAAGLLKQFLRELPQPLIPNGGQFLDVIKSLRNDHETCMLSLKALISQLPDENFYTLRYLIRFLHRIAAKNEENRMTSSNLGIVFAPNIFRICTDNIQMIYDQTAANEVVTLLILEFNELFNETGVSEQSELGGAGSGGSGGAEAAGAGAASSHEDLSSSVISCDSDPMYPCTADSPGGCSMNTNNDNLEETGSLSDNNNNIGNNNNNNSAANITLTNPQGESRLVELDRKRKEYQSRNLRTIEDDDVDIATTSIVGSGNTTTTTNNNNLFFRPHGSPLRQPQRSNSDGNSGVGSGEEFCHLVTSNEQVTLSYGHLEQGGGALGAGNKSSLVMPLAGIIITNSSDSVSTDDNTTTTATSTGATVCSVIFKGGNNSYLELNKSDQSISPEGSSGGGSGGGPRPTTAIGNRNKIDRTASCGSEDCTENVYVASSLNIGSDEEPPEAVGDEEEDSLSKSIASDCSDGDDDSEDSSSSSSSSEDLGEQDDANGATVLDEVNKSKIKAKKMNQTQKTKPWTWVETKTSVDEVPEVSPSAYQSHLDERLNGMEPPSPPLNTEARVYETKEEEGSKSSPPKTKEDTLSVKVPALKNRRLNSIRRKLRQFEHDFAGENGFHPRFEHKMGSSFARPLMIELSSILNVATIALKDLEAIEVTNKTGEEGLPSDERCVGLPAHTTSPGVNSNMSTEDIFNVIFGDPNSKSLEKISEMMDEIQRTLQEKRQTANRPEELEAMTTEQIFDEKLALQKALLRFEAMYGRPCNKAERDIVRPVYDRYRQVKRYASRMLQKMGSKESTGSGQANIANDLAPIIENVQMNFISPTHKPKTLSTSIDEKEPNAETSTSSYSMANSFLRTILNTSREDTNLLAMLSDPLTDDTQASVAGTATTQPAAINFHEMDSAQLATQLRALKLTKRNLRSVLRTFENDFYKKTGKRVEKEDRCNMSTVYYVYKNTKGKIKLIEALISKHTSAADEHRAV